MATQEKQSGRGIAYVAVAISVVALVVAVLPLLSPTRQVPAPSPTSRNVTLVADLVAGSNRYQPASFIAFQGDSLLISVRNNGDREHGFTVEGVGITDTVQNGTSKVFTLENVRPGLYQYYCQLHPAHIGGQLLVLPR